MLCEMDKWNLFLSKNVILLGALTILIHHFVLLFSILSQKKKFYVKRKSNTQQSSMIFFFVFYIGWTYILRVSSFQCWKKVAKMNICPSDMCLSDIITASWISLIILFIKYLLSHNKFESYPSVYTTWWNKKKVHSFE